MRGGERGLGWRGIDGEEEEEGDGGGGGREGGRESGLEVCRGDLQGWIDDLVSGAVRSYTGGSCFIPRRFVFCREGV